MNSELERAEDLEFDEIPEKSFSFFGNVVDFVKEKTEALSQNDLGRDTESFLEMRYYLCSNHSELLRRTNTHMSRNFTEEIDNMLLKLEQKYSSKSANPELSGETPDTPTLHKTISSIVPERTKKELTISPTPAKTGLRFSHIVEFLILIQELTQVHLCLVKVLLKAEENVVKRLALYGFLVLYD